MPTPLAAAYPALRVKEYTQVPAWWATRNILRLIIAYTGETLVVLVYRLALRELRRVERAAGVAHVDRASLQPPEGKVVSLALPKVQSIARPTPKKRRPAARKG